MRVEGLQIRQTATSQHGDSGILIQPAGVADVRASHNIIRGVDSAAFWHCGIEIYAGAAGSVARFWNNVIYDFSDLGGPNDRGQGIYVTDSSYTAYVFNNTVYNTSNAYLYDAGGGGRYIAKNNIAFNNLQSDYGYVLGMDAASDNNLGEDAAFPQDSNYVQTSQAAAQMFVNPAGFDFHILRTFKCG